MVSCNDQKVGQVSQRKKSPSFFPGHFLGFVSCPTEIYKDCAKVHILKINFSFFQNLDCICTALNIAFFLHSGNNLQLDCLHKEIQLQIVATVSWQHNNQRCMDAALVRKSVYISWVYLGLNLIPRYQQMCLCSFLVCFQVLYNLLLALPAPFSALFLPLSARIYSSDFSKEC